LRALSRCGQVWARGDTLPPVKAWLEFADNNEVQKVFDVLTKPLEVSLHLLEKTWVGSVADAIIGKEVVASAIFATFRFLKKLQTTWSS
jgi:hypothetical protein